MTNDPRPLVGDGELPVQPVALWQWRRKGQPWNLEKTFEHEVFATTDDSEVRRLYAAPVGQPAPDVQS